MNKYNYAIAVYGATNYRFKFYDAVTNVLSATKVQSSTQIWFNTVPGLVFNKTYNWTVEVEYFDSNTSTSIYGPASSNICSVTLGMPPAINIAETDLNSANERIAVKSFETIDRLNDITLYPNPNNGEFSLLVNEITSNMVVEVYNSVGQIVIKESIIQDRTAINIAKEANGIYFVKVIDGNKTVTFKKIVKQ
jgi:hypothetical protein